MNKESKITKTIEIILTFISGILICGFAAWFSFQSNKLTKINMNPYFNISSITYNDEKTGYIINNNGGYIQNATITLQNLIKVQVRGYTGEYFYFPYDAITRNYANLEDNDIVIDFNDKSFGINNWNNKSDITQMLCQKFSDQDIGVIIYYIELLQLQYMDVSRDIHQEKYIIGKNEDGTLFLSLPTEEYLEDIKMHTHNNILGTNVEVEDSTSIAIGSTGSSGGRRGTDRSYIFTSSIAEVVKTYINEISHNLSK